MIPLLCGRPKQFDGPPISVRLPKTLHDTLSREALRREMQLSDLIRERLGCRISKLDGADKPATGRPEL